jgi:hypothetical protein
MKWRAARNDAGLLWSTFTDCRRNTANCCGGITAPSTAPWRTVSASQNRRRSNILSRLVRAKCSRRPLTSSPTRPSSTIAPFRASLRTRPLTGALSFRLLAPNPGIARSPYRNRGPNSAELHARAARPRASGLCWCGVMHVTPASPANFLDAADIRIVSTKKNDEKDRSVVRVTATDAADRFAIHHRLLGARVGKKTLHTKRP